MAGLTWVWGKVFIIVDNKAHHNLSQKKHNNIFTKSFSNTNRKRLIKCYKR
jgi:hypothetical protein